MADQLTDPLKEYRAAVADHQKLVGAREQLRRQLDAADSQLMEAFYRKDDSGHFLLVAASGQECYCPVCSLKAQS